MDDTDFVPAVVSFKMYELRYTEMSCYDAESKQSWFGGRLRLD